MLTIRHLEELSLNALPARETLYYDGWVLRFAGGYPRRANSIQLLYPSILPLDEKIAYCEAQYDARGIKTVFKFTDHAPRDLADALRERGYVEDSVTAVQTLDLANIRPQPTHADVLIEPRLSESWLEDYLRFAGIARYADNYRAILSALSLDAAYTRLIRDGEVVALGLGVVDQGWFGLFDIVTSDAARRQGFGRNLVLHLLKWGKERGAHHAYLQVMLQNAPALALYDKLGFAETYRYRYLQNRL